MSVPDFASVAALAGEPARAAILALLFDGRAMPAGQLAREAAISPATASVHLSKLVQGGLLRVRSQGRHRYYEFTHAEVAQTLEALGSIAMPAPVQSLADSLRMQRLRCARSCYNHLAGELAIAIVRTLVARGALEAEGDGFRLRDSAYTVFREVDVDTKDLFPRASAHVTACIDWTERRRHISGPLWRCAVAGIAERQGPGET